MNITKRTEKLRDVRDEGFIPGVLYGKGFESVSIQAPIKEFKHALREFGTSKTFTLKLDGKKHIVYIKDYQTHNMKASTILHFDLVKVSQDDTLQANIHVNILGREVFEASSNLLNINLDQVEIEYNVGSGISSVDVDVSELTLDTAIYVKDIVVPEGVKILNDPEQLVASLSVIIEKEEVAEEEEDEVTVVPADEEEEE